MTNSRFIVLDSESDGLAYECTKLHVMSWTEDGKEYQSTNSYDEMRKVLTQEGVTYVAHNAIMHDMVVFHRILGIPMNYSKWADTLALSWYLFPKRAKHGLDSWGADLGVMKPKIDNWENLSYEEYKHRCEEDTKINWRLWEILKMRLIEIYE